jgi:hypothetical protein
MHYQYCIEYGHDRGIGAVIGGASTLVQRKERTDDQHTIRLRSKNHRHYRA